MTVRKQFRLPDVGEGLTEAEILRWCVGVGDRVAVNQTIVEVETAKAAVELPCPFDGTVTDLHVSEGETVEVGTPIITVEVAAPTGAAPGGTRPAGAPDTAPGGGSAPADASTPAAANGAAAGPGAGREAVLVGYGVRPGSVTRRPRRTPAPPTAPAVASPAMRTAPRPAPAADAQAAPAEALPAGGGTPHPQPNGRVLAKPPVRKLAKDLGVDLASVAPTGHGGVVTHEDVRAAARQAEAVAAAPAPVHTRAGGAAPGTAAPADEERIPVRGVRRATAEAMVRSAFTAPHASVSVTVDVERSLSLVRKLRTLPEFDGVRVSPLLLVARALLLAVRRHPEANSRWDAATDEIVRMRHVNLGIAAATPRGLLVPTIRRAESLSLLDLARALNTLVATARAGRCTPEDLTGGTITITNVGVFGVDSGTPILNPGEAVILALGAIVERPWVIRDADGRAAVRPRRVVTLTASFDHRIIDGEAGSRFLADVAAVLRDPDLALAWS